MLNVLVSGASGIVGYGILKSLRSDKQELTLLGSSIYSDSVAGAFCDNFVLAPRTDCDSYLDWLKSVIEEYQIDVLIPGIEADMISWNQHRQELESFGVKLVLNRSELIVLCLDKYNFYIELKEQNSSYAIDSSLDTNYQTLVNQFGLPIILKPRRGFGSKGIVRVNAEADFEPYQSRMGNEYMAQPFVGEDEHEYTVAAFCDGKGGLYNHICFERKLSESGFTEKASVCEVPQLSKAIRDLCSIFKPVGPTNFQFRLEGKTPKLLEINPRISSSTSIRTAFGYNECQMAVDYFVCNRPPAQVAVRRGSAVRYIEDYIIYEDRHYL